MRKLYRRVSEWRDQRNELALRRGEVETLRGHFDEVVRRNGLKFGSDAYELAYAEHRMHTQLPLADIDRLETLRAMERAMRWGAAVPNYPAEPAAVLSPYWDWNIAHQRYYLTQKGHREIRHAVAVEQDILQRPWLSWAAIAISVLSLVVAVLKP